MLWIKALHIVFLVTWFAGLFYLPRLYVYHASATDLVGIERFKTMERRLFVITTVGGTGTLLFGLWLLWLTWEVFRTAGWLHTKLLLVALLIAYHVYLGRLMFEFRHGLNRHGERFYRWLNEVPGVALIAIVVLAVVKPF